MGYLIRTERENDGLWIATIPERRVMAYGDTEEEAAEKAIALADEPRSLSTPVPHPEHMPWFSAHSEYDAGYNAGIAAAAAMLKRMVEDDRSMASNPYTSHRNYVVDACARAVLTLMRPEGR